MGKIGYIIAAVLIVVLGTYALWPAPVTTTVKALVLDHPPAAWTSTSGALTQEVGKDKTIVTVRRAGAPPATYEFATDPERLAGPWQALASIEVAPNKVLKDIGEAQLAAYGIDGTHQATASDGGLRVMWGGADGKAYVWNGATRQLFAVEPQMLPALDGAARPAIRAQVLQQVAPPTRVTVDGLGLVLDQDGRWVAELFRNRPPFNPRVRNLIGTLGGVAIEDFGGIPVFGLQPVGTVELGAGGGAPGMPALPAIGIGAPGGLGTGGRTVTVYATGDSGVVAISGYPAQRVPPAQFAALRAAFAAFKRDVLVDVFSAIAPDDVLRVRLTRDGKPWWSLERRDKPPAVGGFYWDLVWAGGRESAPDDAVRTLATVAGQAAVRDPAPNPEGLSHPPSGAVTVTFESDRAGSAPVVFAVGGGELLTLGHRARLADDGALLAALEPSRHLDDRLTRRDAARVAKIQRRFHDETVARDEVVVRNEGGTWARSWPKPATGAPPPVESAAIDRLIRTLAAARMQGATLIAAASRDDGSRALLAAPDFELDVRFAAVAGGQASNDETDLDLSAAQDWGIALKRDGAAWTGVDKDLGVRFTLDDETVGELRRPFDSGQIYPVVASVVSSIELVDRQGVRTTLKRDGAAWTVAVGNGDAQPADPLAVRRYFRTLGALAVPAGAALDTRAPEPIPGEVQAQITCAVPSVAGDPFVTSELLTLAVLKPAAGGTQVHVWSNRGNSRFPRGRAVLSDAQVAELLPDGAAFRK